MTGSRAQWLAAAFWIVSCLELAFLAGWLLKFFVGGGRGDHGQYGGVVAMFYLGLAVLLAGLMVSFALVHHLVYRGLALALVALPPLALAFTLSKKQVTTPSIESLAAGHGYFKLPADCALADAIVARDVHRVAELAPAANLNALGYNSMTFMRLALYVRTQTEGKPDPALIAALLKAGINPDWGMFLFGSINTGPEDNEMIGHKNEPLLRAVIDAGVDLNHLDELGRPRFFEALGWPEGLALMLERGAKVEAEDKDGNTAIMVAVDQWYWPAVEVLLAHGARIDHVAHGGRTLRDAVKEKVERFSNGSAGGMPPQLAGLVERLR